MNAVDCWNQLIRLRTSVFYQNIGCHLLYAPILMNISWNLPRNKLTIIAYHWRLMQKNMKSLFTRNWNIQQQCCQVKCVTRFWKSGEISDGNPKEAWNQTKFGWNFIRFFSAQNKFFLRRNPANVFLTLYLAALYLQLAFPGVISHFRSVSCST